MRRSAGSRGDQAWRGEAGANRPSRFEKKGAGGKRKFLQLGTDWVMGQAASGGTCEVV